MLTAYSFVRLVLALLPPAAGAACGPYHGWCAPPPDTVAPLSVPAGVYCPTQPMPVYAAPCVARPADRCGPPVVAAPPVMTYAPEAAYGPPAVYACPPLTPPVPEAKTEEILTRELVAILNETTSTDTFCLTARMLASSKADRRLAIPAIIRNAERLKITQGIFLREEDEWTREQEMVIGCLESLAEDLTPANTSCRKRAPRSRPPAPTQAQRAYEPGTR